MIADPVLLFQFNESFIPKIEFLALIGQFGIPESIGELINLKTLPVQQNISGFLFHCKNGI